MSSQTPVTITVFITEAFNPSPKSGAAPLSSRSSRHKEMRFKQKGGKAVLVAPGQGWVGQGARMPRAWWQGWDVFLEEQELEATSCLWLLPWCSGLHCLLCSGEKRWLHPPPCWDHLLKGMYAVRHRTCPVSPSSLSSATG